MQVFSEKFYLKGNRITYMISAADFLNCLIFLVAMMAFKLRLERIVQTINKKSVTAADFSVFVKRLPAGELLHVLVSVSVSVTVSVGLCLCVCVSVCICYVESVLKSMRSVVGRLRMHLFSRWRSLNGRVSVAATSVCLYAFVDVNTCVF